MDPETLSNALQAGAILAAVGASIVALVIASQDRANAQRIAAEDHRESARQARLMFELDAAQRLSVNLARGGHTDPVTRGDMGAEALALVALLGPERVPRLWERKVGKDDADMRAFIEDEDKLGFRRDAVEAARAARTIAAELRAHRNAQ